MADQNIPVFSEEDLALLKEMANEHRSRKSRSPSREPVRDYRYDFFGPECYIAVPKTIDGIPALIPATSEHGAIPGAALCDVVKLINGMFYDAGFDLVVYNFGAYSILQTWIKIHRSKFGYWYAENSCCSDGDPPPPPGEPSTSCEVCLTCRERETLIDWDIPCTLDCAIDYGADCTGTDKTIQLYENGFGEFVGTDGDITIEARCMGINGWRVDLTCTIAPEVTRISMDTTPEYDPLEIFVGYTNLEDDNFLCCTDNKSDTILLTITESTLC